MKLKYKSLGTGLLLYLGTFLVTDAQIQNWVSIPLNTNRDLFEIKPVNDSIIIAAGDSGSLAIRLNQTEWNLLQAPTEKSLVSTELIRFKDEGWKTKIITSSCDVFTISPDGQLVLDDTLPAYPTGNIKSNKLVNLNISSINETRYGIISDSGKIMGYKFPFATPRFDFSVSTKKSVTDMYPFSTWSILAIGDSGKIWRTGSLYNPFTAVNHSLTSLKLNKVIGKRDNKIWIAGDSGLVLFSQNGGQNWVKMNTPTTKNLYSGSIKDSLLWICGSNGLIMKSNNEGQSWQIQNSNTSCKRRLGRR